jgi:DEAD/DEAH box helicase domain-containing protein
VKKETETTIEGAERVERQLGVELHFGRVSVTEQVVGFARKEVQDGSTIDVTPMLMPETTFETEAVWFCPEPTHLEGHEQMPKLLGTLHAAEHTLIALLPLWAMCDRWDIGGLSTNVHYQTGRPTIFVYDGHSGGVGITERGFDRFGEWVEDTRTSSRAAPAKAAAAILRSHPQMRQSQRAAPSKIGALTAPPRRMLAAD